MTSTLPEHTGTEGWRWVVVLALVAAAPFVTGKAHELATPDAFDSGAYVYSAQRVLSGARIGIDEKPSAQPGTLLVNMLGVWLGGFNETGPKLVQALLQVVALGFMLVALSRLWGRLAAAAGVVLATFYLSAPVIAKVGNVKEQYMIACMVIGVCCLILHQLGGSRWWAVAAGVALAWAPLFKQTGISAILAAAVFLLARHVLHHRSWRLTGRDVLLLLAGAAAGLLPVLVWLAVAGAPATYWPYSTFVRMILPTAGERVGSYVTESRKLMPAGDLAPIVLRYYQVLALPIVLALISLIVAAGRWVRGRRTGDPPAGPCFVLLLGTWWALDMALVWVSPRSYEQYYLPLTASGAMLGAYAVGLLGRRLARGGIAWRVGAAAALVVAVVLAAPIVIGLSHSPFSGSAYSSRRRGYAQSVSEVILRRARGPLYSWERAGDDIREHTGPDDTIYVWGWYPGLYVRAQRVSPTARACVGSMHTMAPEELGERVAEILAAFERQSPAVIVDSRKRHFPWDRPPLELWPRTPRGFLSAHPRTVRLYDQAHSSWLAERFGEAEAARFAAMAPLREHVMRRYVVAAEYGEHVVFRRRGPPPPRDAGR